MDSSTIGLHHRVVPDKRITIEKKLSKSRSHDVRATYKSINKKKRHENNHKGRAHYHDGDEHYGDYKSEITPKYNKYQSRHYGSFSKQLISAEPPQVTNDVPTLQRLREKIEAIRLVDPYYQTKLSQNELDNFVKESNDKRHNHGDSQPIKHLDMESSPPPRNEPEGRSTIADRKPIDDKKSVEAYGHEAKRSSRELDKTPSRRSSKQKENPSDKDKDKDKDKGKDKNRKGNCANEDYCDDEQDHPSGMTFAQFRNFLMHSTCTEIGAIKKSTIHMCNEYCRGGCKRIPVEDDDDDDDEGDDCEEVCCCSF